MPVATWGGGEAQAKPPMSSIPISMSSIGLLPNEYYVCACVQTKSNYLLST